MGNDKLGANGGVDHEYISRWLCADNGAGHEGYGEDYGGDG